MQPKKCVECNRPISSLRNFRIEKVSLPLREGKWIIYLSGGNTIGSTVKDPASPALNLYFDIKFFM